MKRNNERRKELNARKRIFKNFIKEKIRNIPDKVLHKFKLELNEVFDYQMELDIMLSPISEKIVYKFVTDGEIPPAISDYIHIT